MLINISPLKKYPDFRWLYFGQFISLIGSMISYVAIPYEVYQLTKSNAIVGALGVVQLVPMVIFSLLGGTYADRINRKKLLITVEILMMIILMGFSLNSLRETPSVTLIFVLAALFQSVNGFHRPAMEAISQQIVEKHDYTLVGALTSFRYSITAIVGPAIGGIVIANFGMAPAYLIDAFTFLMAIFSLLKISKFPDPETSEKNALEDMKEGFRFAMSKPELIGTYLIDIVAMAFAYPIALYPAMSEQWGGAQVAGWLFSAMSVGALLSTLISGWTTKVHFRGRAVIYSAVVWGIFISACGYSQNLIVVIICLGLAGAADMFSALFRKVIWNETIPNYMRGRLSGIEAISFTVGPLLGNARAGFVAAKTSVHFSLLSGGIICVIGVILTACFLPRFWRYRSQ